jgi:hypothetical protein
VGRPIFASAAMLPIVMRKAPPMTRRCRVSRMNRLVERVLAPSIHLAETVDPESISDLT